MKSKSVLKIPIVVVFLLKKCRELKDVEWIC